MPSRLLNTSFRSRFESVAFEWRKSPFIERATINRLTPSCCNPSDDNALRKVAAGYSELTNVRRNFAFPFARDVSAVNDGLTTRETRGIPGRYLVELKFHRCARGSMLWPKISFALRGRAKIKSILN